MVICTYGTERPGSSYADATVPQFLTASSYYAPRCRDFYETDIYEYLDHIMNWLASVFKALEECLKVLDFSYDRS